VISTATAGLISWHATPPATFSFDRRNRTGGFLGKTQIGTGWNTMNAIM
jgi:hypothetical protein